MATNSLDFKVKNGIVVSSTATIQGTTNSISSTTGALIVEGGAGIKKDLYVGDTIYGNLSGTATSADNLTGGTNGSIPYQNGTGTTTFLGIGNNNYVLASNGTTPQWQSLNSLGAGSANTATNIGGGSEGVIPFQTGVGATGFFGPGTFGQLLVSAGTTSTGPVFTNTASIKVGSATIADKWETARTVTLSGDLSGSVDIDGSTNVTLTATIQADSVALGTDTTGDYIASGTTTGYGISGSTSGEGAVFTVTSNATSTNSVSTIVYRDASGNFYAGTITATNVSVTSSTDASSTNSAALVVTGGAGIGQKLYVGGDITTVNGQLSINARETTDGSIKSQVTISSTGTFDTAPIAGIEFSAQYAPSTGAGLGGISVGKLNTTSGDYSSYLSLHTRNNGSGVTEQVRIDNTGSVILYSVNQSASTQTGALIVTGGAGIGKDLYVGGTANIAGTISLSNTTNSTSTNTGALTVAGGIGINKDIFVGGKATIVDISTFTNITETTNTNEASVIFKGGVAVTKNLVVGGKTSIGGSLRNWQGSYKVLQLAESGLFVSNTLPYLQILSNAYWDPNGAYRHSDTGYATRVSLANGGFLVGTSNTLASSDSFVTDFDDAFLVNGSGNTYVYHDLAVLGGNITTTATTFTIANTTATTVEFAKAATAITIGDTTGYTNIRNLTTLTNSTDASSTVTGSLVVTGGAGIGKKLYVGDDSTFSGDLLPSADNSYDLGSPSNRWKTLYVTSGTIDIGGQTLSTNNGAIEVDTVRVTTSTVASSTTTGGLQVIGGVGIGQNVYIGSTDASTTTLTSNALYVEGGAGIKGSLYVTGKAVFDEDVVFLGTSTYIYSTQTVITDNLINLHIPNAGDPDNHAWTVDDGKDIGHVYHYYDGADKDAGLILANDTRYLEWYVNGTESGSVFTGTDYGVFKTGGIRLVHTTSSNSTQTGALTVVGGVGIGENIIVGGSGRFNGTFDEAASTTTVGLYVGVAGSAPASPRVAFANSGTTWQIDNYNGNFRWYIPGLVRMQIDTNGTLSAYGTVQSTSTTTGALVVSGGVGIAKNLHIGGDVVTPNTEQASLTVPVSSASATTVDTWATATYRTAKYLVQITQGSNYQSAELLVVHDGSDAYISEYAIVRTNTNLGTFTADVNSGNVRLRVTMNSASAATIKISRLLIVV